MFKTLLAKVRGWLERYARWQAQGYLNHQLSRRITGRGGEKYEWQLYSRNNSDCSWRQLMWGDSYQRVVACTVVVTHQKREVVVGGWFSYGQIASVDGTFPPLYVQTEVLAHKPIFSSDWERKPALFDNPTTFALLAAQY